MEFLEEYDLLLEMVNKKYPDVDILQYVGKKEVTASPICRVAFCENKDGVVTYFLVASMIDDAFVFYTSSDW